LSPPLDLTIPVNVVLLAMSYSFCKSSEEAMLIEILF
jgi:hypothetical protein